MNLIKNKSLHPHLRDDEALVLENAIRLAIDSILNVLYGVNSARAHEYQRMVADRDKEIQRLERELQVLRGQGCACGMLFANETDLGRFRTSGDRREAAQTGLEAEGCADTEMTDGAQECEMRLSLGVFARPPSRVSSFSHESAPPSSPSRLGSDQTSTSRSSEASGVTEAADAGNAGNLPANPRASPSSLVVKEEPCDINAILIEWEMSEERLSEHQERPGSPRQDRESPGVNGKPENIEMKKSKEKPQADPGGCGAAEGEPRNKKKSVRMSELPEEAQRLKRAAWRAASRRYYARKMARQKANPSRSAPFVHITSSQDSHPNWLTDKRRRTLMSELPDASQTMQRDAWRTSSRRHYARRVAHQQTEHEQYGHLLEDLNPSGATQAPNREGPRANGGGIMCS